MHVGFFSPRSVSQTRWSVKTRDGHQLITDDLTRPQPLLDKMSINTEFDFWPEERLAALVTCLQKFREGKPLPPKADERDHLPSAPPPTWLWAERWALLSTRAIALYR